MPVDIVIQPRNCFTDDKWKLFVLMAVKMVRHSIALQNYRLQGYKVPTMMDTGPSKVTNYGISL